MQVSKVELGANSEIRHLINLAKDSTNVRDSSKAQEQLEKILPNFHLSTLEDLKTFKQVEAVGIPSLSILLRKNTSFLELENSTPGKVTILLEDITKYAVENSRFFDGIHTFLINLRENLISGRSTLPLTETLPRRKTYGYRLLRELAKVAKEKASAKKEALPLISEKINELTSMFLV